ncbi:hypothetical protein J7M28_12955 [bacterium]|nr:hypothetical protein [bacterium]
MAGMFLLKSVVFYRTRRITSHSAGDEGISERGFCITPSILRAFVFTFCIFVLLLANSARCSTSVVAVGRSVVISEDRSGARSRAMRDAYRDAIERVCGVEIGALTSTRNLQLLFNVVLTQARGYVASRQVVDEGVDDNGLYFIKIKAQVEKGDIRDNSQALKLLLAAINNPRVGVLFVIDKASDRPLASSAEATLVKRMVDAGYYCVALRQDMSKGAEMPLDGSISKAQRAARDANVQLLVIGHLNPSLALDGNRKDALLPGYFAVNIDVDLRVILVQTSKVLHVENPRVKSGPANTEEMARGIAAKKAGEQVAGELIWSLPQKLLQGGRTFEFSIANCDFGEYRKLQTVIGQLETVEALNPRPWKKGVGVFDVTVGYFGLDIRDLATLLSLNKHVPVELKAVGSDTLKARVIR